MIIENKTVVETSKPVTSEASHSSILKLLHKINTLLTEISHLRSRNKELEKIYNENNVFLKDISNRNPLYKKAQDLMADAQNRLERVERKKEQKHF